MALGGEDTDLTNDYEIMKIKSPIHSVTGPFKVIYTDVKSRWSIVALDWNENHSLAMRWFWDNVGQPISHGLPTWFIIPSELYSTILTSLPIDLKIRTSVENYLLGKISGEELMMSNA